MIAFLNDEDGADTIQELLDVLSYGGCEVSMSAAQKIEVYYDRIKIGGRDHAEPILELIDRTGIKTIDIITDGMIREAGRLKAAYKISFADCLGLAAAVYIDGIFVTADHHELEAVAREEAVRFLWFR